MAVFHDTSVNRTRMQEYRLARVRAQLRARDCMGIVIYDSCNVRYATDHSNMQVWTIHNKSRYAFIALEGPVIIFDFYHCDHLSSDLPLVDEVRGGQPYFYFEAGSRVSELAGKWADEIADLVRAHGGGNMRLAVDKLDPPGLYALQERGVEVFDGECIMEEAKAVKSSDEIVAIRESIAACEEGMRRMRLQLEPGITENALWSILHQTNIELGGEWIETRLLTSGHRTFPWFRECSDRVIRPGEVVSFDTDMVGPNGYCADLSRSWICGDYVPQGRVRDIIEVAVEQIENNIAALRAGLTFRQYAERANQLPEDFRDHRYSVIAHGIGMCDEYPAIRYLLDWERSGYDGEIVAGMVLCVESLVGHADVGVSIKLERQVLVTENGTETLDVYPLRDPQFA